jgi:hypothetical protein
MWRFTKTIIPINIIRPLVLWINITAFAANRIRAARIVSFVFKYRVYLLDCLTLKILRLITNYGVITVTRGVITVVLINYVITNLITVTRVNYGDTCNNPFTKPHR